MSCDYFLSFPVSIGSETTLTVSHPTTTKLTQKELRRIVDGNLTTCLRLGDDNSADSMISIRASFGKQCRAVTSINIVTGDSPSSLTLDILVKQIDLCSEFQNEAITSCNKSSQELSTFLTYNCLKKLSKAVAVAVPVNLSICELMIAYKRKPGI